MTKQKCNYADRCPVFSGELKEDDKPLFLYHNIFCLSGRRGWNACKRHNLYEMNIDPGKKILPENNDPLEELSDKLSDHNTGDTT